MKPHSDEKKRVNNPNSHPAKLAPGYCKKLKGAHDYGFLNAQIYNHHMLDRQYQRYDRVSVMIERQCSGCGKIKRSLKWIQGDFDINASLASIPLTNTME